MEMKDRIVYEEGEAFSVLLAPACDCQAAESHKADLEKDFHLVQSALATGQTILSNESTFPRFIALACPTVRELASLYYANPAVEDDACRLWIKAGAEKEPNRRIDNWFANHHS